MGHPGDCLPSCGCAQKGCQKAVQNASEFGRHVLHMSLHVRSYLKSCLPGTPSRLQAFLLGTYGPSGGSTRQWASKERWPSTRKEQETQLPSSNGALMTFKQNRRRDGKLQINLIKSFENCKSMKFAVISSISSDAFFNLTHAMLRRLWSIKRATRN